MDGPDRRKINRRARLTFPCKSKPLLSICKDTPTAAYRLIPLVDAKCDFIILLYNHARIKRIFLQELFR